MTTIAILIVTIGLPLHLAYMIMTMSNENRRSNARELSRWN